MVASIGSERIPEDMFINSYLEVLFYCIEVIIGYLEVLIGCFSLGLCAFW